MNPMGLSVWCFCAVLLAVLCSLEVAEAKKKWHLPWQKEKHPTTPKKRTVSGPGTRGKKYATTKKRWQLPWHKPSTTSPIPEWLLPTVSTSPEKLEEVPLELMITKTNRLSDSELAALAHSQDEIGRYIEPEYVSVPQYEVIETRDGYPRNLAAVLEPYPRDWRSLSVANWASERDNGPEYIIVPEEAVSEALQEEQDKRELGERIAEIAQTLNERATRRRFY